ncbi:src substrate cortactin isoform X1 [Carassius gibelio]|uniref:src substrate cortactin isoform X1 n=1 Tax=Carassius gibelio TaxID=101364 RepID=UPI002278F393|nr:src substrate cortactin isoform X1 [Carassius gibelio]
MWKSVVGHDVNVKVESEGDDWETDPNFENDVSEQEQRWGSRTIEGSGRKEHISIADLRQNVSREHEVVKKKELEQGPKASYGYGGKFGVEKDRMDKGALGHSYVAEVEKHSSQTDAAKGFGGKFGVQKDRVDKSAMNYEYKGEVQQHASQKDYAKGFGGKYGVQKERVDKAAVGYDYKGETEKHQSQKDYAKGFGGKYGVEKEKVDKAALGYDYKGETEKHQSQKDYAKGFGGKYGVEKEKVDKAALGYDYKGETEKHQSQKDYAKGFGGRYGVEADRMDKSAASFSDMESPSSSYEKPQAFEASSVGAGNLKARFENMAKASDEENRKKAEEERVRRLAREKREREEAQRKQEEQSKREEKEEIQRPPPVPASQNPPETFRKLPEIPRDEPEEEAQVEEDPEYEEPPLLPPRPADLIEEEEEEEQTYAECESAPVPQEEDYEDIGSYTTAAGFPNSFLASSTAADNDYEELSGAGRTATAIYDYQGEASDEISFMPGDIITNVEMVDEGWWKGTCHGRTGLFPASFVELQ